MGSKKVMSLFDVLGPVMTGPSSSATAGACRIGRVGRMLLGGEPDRIGLTFTESFGCKYSGNCTDAAVVGGLLGLAVDAPELRNALDMARARGIALGVALRPDPPAGDGPAPISIGLTLGRGGESLSLTGLSIGGGEILISEVEGIPTALTGAEDTLLVFASPDATPAFPNLPGLPAAAWQAKGGGLYQAFPAQMPAPDHLRSLQDVPGVLRVRPLESLLDYRQCDNVPLFASLAVLTAWCEQRKAGPADAAIAYEMKRSGMTEREVRERGSEIWRVMQEAMTRGLAGENAVLRRLVPGDAGRRLAGRVGAGRAFSGHTAGMAAARALAGMEFNACMGRVVAAPTAGACGLLPGVLFAAAEQLGSSEKTVTEALLVSAAVGVIIAARAPVSGTMGGCQSEVGVASAMGAAALVFMDGGGPREMEHAVAISLKNVMGLICDPVAGAVEVPCIKRNAMGVMNAMIAADMALAGVTSAIPADEVVTALVAVQRELSPVLRNSGRGGLCVTPTAVRLTEEHLGNGIRA